MTSKAGEKNPVPQAYAETATRRNTYGSVETLATSLVHFVVSQPRTSGFVGGAKHAVACLCFRVLSKVLIARPQDIFGYPQKDLTHSCSLARFRAREHSVVLGP